MAGPLTILGICDGSTGYGQMVAHVGEQLERLGTPVEFSPIYRDESVLPLPRFVADRLADRLADRKPDGPCLVMGAPWTEFPPGSVVLTMWEATRLPERYVGPLNTARMVIVPSFAVRDWFRASGVTAPISVVPLGIDPEVYHPRGRRPGPAPFVRFGCSGRTVGRKGLFEAIVAFLAAFPADSGEKVRLDVKVFGHCPTPVPEDPRIEVIREDWSDRQMADWYRSLDVFVSASKGEGWGLQPHQAMACGAPCIAPLWGGHADYMDPRTCYPVEYSERTARGAYESDGALWCEPHHGSLVAQMRRALEEPLRRSVKGFESRERARRLTWENSGGLLRAALIESGLIQADSPAES